MQAVAAIEHTEEPESAPDEEDDRAEEERDDLADQPPAIQPANSVMKRRRNDAMLRHWMLSPSSRSECFAFGCEISGASEATVASADPGAISNPHRAQ